MTPSEFLSYLLPKGLVVIAELAGTGFKHHVFESIAAADECVSRIVRAGKDCYFGLGTLVEPRVWNETTQKWTVRTGNNIKELKSLFVDIDIEQDNERKYSTADEALAALDLFCEQTAFPPPMVVSSGGGLHCYWSFTNSIPAEAWRPVAVSFKESLQRYGIKFDPSRTADASSVLRVVGTSNFKKETPRPVRVIRNAQQYSPKAIHLCVKNLAENCGARAPVAALAAPKTAFDAMPSNLATVYEPAAFGPIVRQCRQIQELLVDGGYKNEPAWYAALSVTRLCTESEKASMFVSCNFPNFERSGMDRRLQQLKTGNVGPSLCSSFNEKREHICTSCPHWGKIKTPIVLGRNAAIPATEEKTFEMVEEADDGTKTVTTVTLPVPPFPYTRRAAGGILMAADKEDAAPIVLYENDIYPLRRMVNERRDIEETVWNIKIPIVGWTEVVVPQAILAESVGLHSFLLSKGVYVHPAKTKVMASFMVAYITQLQREVKIEKLYSKLGFRDDNKVFVLGDKIYRPNGVVDSHQLSSDMQNEIPGLQRKGTLEGWKEAIQFYNAPGHEAHRFMLYGAFGSPLLHMTGHLGVIVNASGPSGAGKTRTLNAINSVWGHPQTLGTSGSKEGATTNARYALLSVYNNLPFCFDEITYLPKGELSQFCMCHTQGRGKVRAVRSGAISRVAETWANIVYASGNTDAYIAIMQNRRDAEAEVMRILQIPFTLPKAYTEQQADKMFQNGLLENYGHAAHEFVPYLVDKYDKIRETVRDVVAMTAKRGRMVAAERFQSGAIGSHIVGAIMARKLGLLEDFPIERDWEWAIDQIEGVRSAVRDNYSSPREIMSEFLDSRVSETLVISDTVKANIAPRIDQIPRGALTVRHELDTGLIYISKAEFKRYCIETGANYGAIQETLIATNVLLDNDSKKVLGSGTDFGRGQVRCWTLNVKELQR